MQCTESFTANLSFHYQVYPSSLIKIGRCHVPCGQGSNLRQGWVNNQMYGYNVLEFYIQVILQSASGGGILSEKTDFCRHLRYKEKSREVEGGIVFELLH